MGNEFLEALKEPKESEPQGESQQQQEPHKEEQTDPRDFQIQQLSNTVSQLHASLNQLTGKIEVLTQRPQEKEESFDDDIELTPQKVREIAESIAESKVNKATETMKTEDLQKTWDIKADDDFGPYGFMNKQSKFYIETYKEFQSSPNKTSPTAVYDAASRTLTRGLKDGWIRPNEVQNALRNYSVQSAALGGATPAGRQTPKKQMTDEMKYFARHLGLDEKKAKEALEAHSERRMRLVS